MIMAIVGRSLHYKNIDTQIFLSSDPSLLVLAKCHKVTTLYMLDTDPLRSGVNTFVKVA
jgi:hypothetical protein